MSAEQRVDSWMTKQVDPPKGLKYLVDRYLALESVREFDPLWMDSQMNLIYDCLVQFVGGK